MENIFEKTIETNINVDQFKEVISNVFTKEYHENV